MNIRIQYLLIGCFFIICSCSNKLLNPLKNGSNYTGNSAKVNGDLTMGNTEKGNVIYIVPKKSLKVRSVEKGTVLFIDLLKDSSYLIIIKGNVSASYGNLVSICVSKGELIKRGQIIGELFGFDSVVNNNLSLSLIKDGKYLMPNW